MKRRRLIDLPGLADLEQKALMTPRYADADAASEFPEIDECSLALFGLTADQADDVPRPEGWDRIERKPIRDQIAAFDAEGWDVTDHKLRPLRMFSHFNVQLWLAVRGVAGTLPFRAEEDEGVAMTANLAAEAAKFRKSRD
ncbi:MAG: hypothetical protein CGW95_15090 [Phenylobacterium zucineum]|nr:MAG: hypothetical protein CGW95_15090 [Phenylobacterium zucineum]